MAKKAAKKKASKPARKPAPRKARATKAKKAVKRAVAVKKAPARPPAKAPVCCRSAPALAADPERLELVGRITIRMPAAPPPRVAPLLAPCRVPVMGRRMF